MSPTEDTNELLGLRRLKVYSSEEGNILFLFTHIEAFGIIVKWKLSYLHIIFILIRPCLVILPRRLYPAVERETS